MSRLKLCRIGSTTISLHPSTLIFWLYGFLTGHGQLILLGTGSILLHEASHALVSAIFGFPPISLELTPLGAVMRLEEEGKISPLKRLLILFAGPVTTFSLFCIASLLTSSELISVKSGYILFACNLSILLINMLPTLPLDGGRILAVILQTFLPDRIVYRILRWLGTIFGISLICLNVYVSFHSGGWNLSLSFAGCFILYGTKHYTTTQAYIEFSSFLERKIRLEKKGHMRVLPVVVLGHMPIRGLVRDLPPRKSAVYICLEPGTLHLIGILTEYEMVQHYITSPGITMKTAINLSHNQPQSAKYDTK